MQLLMAFFKFLPEFLGLLKKVSSLISSGVEEITIRKRLKEIEDAMALEDRVEAARRLSDVFKK